MSHESVSRKKIMACIRNAWALYVQYIKYARFALCCFVVVIWTSFVDPCQTSTWWRHQMEALSALLAFCAGNSPGTGEFPAQRPVTRSFEVFFDLRLNKRLSKQSWGWWSETPSSSLWRHRNVFFMGASKTSEQSCNRPCAYAITVKGMILTATCT